jgi:hypothetical protein
VQTLFFPGILSSSSQVVSCHLDRDASELGGGALREALPKARPYDGPNPVAD